MAVPKAMMDTYMKKLPSHLTDIQKLSFKPLPYLEAEELETLIQAYGDSLNPLLKYFQKASLSLIDIDVESDEDDDSIASKDSIIYMDSDDPDINWHQLLTSTLTELDNDVDWTPHSPPFLSDVSDTLAPVKWTPPLFRTFSRVAWSQSFTVTLRPNPSWSGHSFMHQLAPYSLIKTTPHQTLSFSKRDLKVCVEPVQWSTSTNTL
ncbi:hypothetical protein C8J57DRAFT_1250016 [Mycena rebaudengoi]|nr:hypothetical protein C8J57DRAFT_1250016 [Mycena rebaudengoi]